jgi:hypothetical protein
MPSAQVSFAASSLMSAPVQIPDASLFTQGVVGPAFSAEAPSSPVPGVVTLNEPLPDASGGVFTLSSAIHSNNGWRIVPSAANEYGPGLGEYEFTIDLAGDLLSDWYLV